MQGTGLANVETLFDNKFAIKSAKSSHFIASKCLLACLLASLQSTVERDGLPRRRKCEGPEFTRAQEPSQPGLAKEAGAISVELSLDPPPPLPFPP